MTTHMHSERGTTLIETMIALALLGIVMGGIITLSAVSAKTTENNGHLAARTTEDAQDKMEQLQALTYGDVVTDTSVFPAAPAGGTGLAVGGSANPVAPVNGYVDWLAADGTALGGGVAAPPTWFYKRVWSVTNFSANVKQITVTVTTKWAFSGATPPSSTVVALKANF
jgi:prepilin-type N-terminal cleavage/methylation domain-containing protein